MMKISRIVIFNFLVLSGFSVFAECRFFELRSDQLQQRPYNARNKVVSIRYQNEVWHCGIALRNTKQEQGFVCQPDRHNSIPYSLHISRRLANPTRLSWIGIEAKNRYEELELLRKHPALKNCTHLAARSLR